jgi:1-phosphofructokinase/6-phosphofructokinase 2
VAFGAAAVGLPGSQMPSPADVAAVRVTLDESPDLDRPLDD